MAVQIDIEIILIMDSEKPLSPEKQHLLTLINESSVTLEDGERVAPTNDAIFIAFDEASHC